MELLELIGRSRGCVISGGRIDFEKVSRLLISELRNGELGCLCLETPEMMVQELAQVEIIRQQKLAKKARRKGIET
jgi:ribosome biogenesis GTPase A